MLSTSVLLVLVAFTLSICLLLSCAFNEEESVLWVGDVAQSLIVQIFITDPTISLLVIFSKLLVSWVILRSGKRRLTRRLQKQQDAVELQIAAVSAHAEVEAAKMTALQLVASGAEADVVREKIAKREVKRKCEVELEGITLAKAQLSRIRQATMRPRKIELHKWDSQEADLAVKERVTRKELRTADAALEVLDGSRDEAQQKLEAAEAKIRELQRRLEKVTREKDALSRKQAQIEDKPRAVVKKSAIVPTTASVRAAGEAFEPGADRATMPSVRSAAEVTDEPRVVERIQTPGISRRRRRATTPGRRRARRSRRESSPDDRGASTSDNADPHTGEGAQRSTTTRRREWRPMSWVEIRALQKKLKETASLSPKGPSARAGGRRRPGSLGKLSPATVKLVLQRRERRRLWLERRAAKGDTKQGEP